MLRASYYFATTTTKKKTKTRIEMGVEIVVRLLRDVNNLLSAKVNTRTHTLLLNHGM